MAKILFAAGDRGSAGVIAEVAKRFPNYERILIADDSPRARAHEVFKKEGIQFESPDIFYGRDSNKLADFDLVVCGTDAIANDLCLYLTRLAKVESVPVVWLEDSYGTGSSPQNMLVVPNWYVTLDEDAKNIVKNSRLDFPVSKIMPLGQPTFDVLVELKRNEQEIRKEIRKKMNLAPHHHLVTYWASGGRVYVVEESLNLIVADLNRLMGVVFAPRFHPKHDNCKETYLEILKRSDFPLVDAFGIRPEYLDLASDVVITNISTEGIKATLMGKPVIYLNGPLSREWLATKGLKHPFVPTVQKGAAFGAGDSGSLSDAFYLAAIDPDGEKRRQTALKNHFSLHLDGKATERIVRFLESFF